jgi:DNA-binding MarR family transcriptional regulator
LFSCTATLDVQIRRKLKEGFNTSLPRFGIMAALARTPNGLTMKELAAAVRVTGAAVTGIVADLCEEDFAVRELDDSDKRSTVVRLTPAGRAAFIRMADAHSQWVERALADVSDAQVSALMKLLSAVRASIDENRI